MQEERLQALEKAILALSPGPFHFPEIFGKGWDRLYVGDKVKFGREFLNLVRKGRFSQVKDTGTKKAGGRVYLRTPE